MESQYKRQDYPEQQPTSPNLPEETSRLFSCNYLSLTQSVIKEALSRYVSNYFSYKKSFLKQMQITDVFVEGIYIYKLETMGEMREKGSSVRPYKLESSIEMNRIGIAPGIWDIPAHPSKLFQDSVKIVDIPHTNYIKQCVMCTGSGYVKCRHCNGSGSLYCEMCRNNGPLMWQGEVCYYCKKWGNEGFVACCQICDGKRELKCTTCEGHGFLMQNETVIVTWLNKVTERVHKGCTLPNINLTDAIGETLICETKQNLRPLAYPFTNLMSEELLRKHQGVFPYIINQRHCLRVIPNTRVNYSWKGITGEFFVYDIDKKVYFKHFPAKWASWNF